MKLHVPLIVIKLHAMTVSLQDRGPKASPLLGRMQVDQIRMDNQGNFRLMDHRYAVSNWDKSDPFSAQVICSVKTCCYFRNWT